MKMEQNCSPHLQKLWKRMLLVISKNLSVIPTNTLVWESGICPNKPPMSSDDFSSSDVLYIFLPTAAELKYIKNI